MTRTFTVTLEEQDDKGVTTHTDWCVRNVPYEVAKAYLAGITAGLNMTRTEHELGYESLSYYSEISNLFRIFRIVESK